MSDEHVTFAPKAPVELGERIRIWPAHVDPTVAYHERMYLVDGEQVVEVFEVDLRLVSPAPRRFVGIAGGTGARAGAVPNEARRP